MVVVEEGSEGSLAEDGGLRKPMSAGSAARRPFSTASVARKARMFMLFIMSSMRA